MDVYLLWISSGVMASGGKIVVVDDGGADWTVFTTGMAGPTVRVVFGNLSIATWWFTVVSFILKDLYTTEALETGSPAFWRLRVDSTMGKS